MKTTTSVVLTGVIVGAGHYAQDKKVPATMFVGLGVVALVLAALGEGNASFAETFGLLMVIAALLYYGEPIAKALNGSASGRRGGSGRF